MSALTSTIRQAEPEVAADRDWWRGAAIYQIYPRSFQDSNGDGIGDLTGIRQRLAHIADLGADAIWISPFFRSPMKDFGYDVSDYRAVDPQFGTLEDFQALIDDAHRLGLKVMIDLVISHTSDQHPWFAESRSSRDNARADWYVWADAKADGTAPNNWLSIFGGPAWEWDTNRRQYYLHNFLASQPDLNFHNPRMRTALLDVTRFWLELGVDGFRLDTINFYFHSQSLKDNPALPQSARNASIAPEVNPYNFQDHLYDKSQPENLDFLRDFRAVLDQFPAAAAVGEVGDAQRGLEIVAQYTSGSDKVHMCYSFDFLSAERPTANSVRSIISKFMEAAPDGWACWAFSNHDVERHASRWGVGAEDHVRFLKLMAALLMCLRGSICIYQGEELGLPEAEVAFEDLQDPYGIRFWPKFKGRDGCRTPIVWSSNLPNGGFSGAKPWLPVPAAHLAVAVNAQSGDETSVYEFYRSFLRLRRREPALLKGEMKFVEAPGDVVAFERIHKGERQLCVFNLGADAASIAAPAGAKRIEIAGIGGKFDGKKISLNAWEGAILRLPTGKGAQV